MATATQLKPDTSRQPGLELRKILAHLVAGLLLFGAVYSFFSLLLIRFPYVQSGADLVVRFKHDLARNGHPFRTTRGLHVMAFGDSKMLSAFLPSLFDREMAGAGFPSVESWNFGLPEDTRFVADLEAMMARGTAPDLVLLTFPWPETQEPGATLFSFARNDREIMNTLFPFRKLPRDFMILASEAHGSPGGVRRLYTENQRAVSQVERDRGYYFIARQSHYEDDALPDGFHAPTDTASSLRLRRIGHGPVFDRLVSAFAAHHIRCLFIPFYYREGEFAPAPTSNPESVRSLEGLANFGISGPDYFLYPNHLFSDPVHVNRPGAEVYTRAVAALVARWLREDTAAGHPTDRSAAGQ